MSQSESPHNDSTSTPSAAGNPMSDGQSDTTGHPTAEGDLPMPPTPGQLGDTPPESPPSALKQAAQLVIIPATIVIVCVGLATLFGKLAGAQESIDSHLMKLRQSGGAGRLAMGLQDPRYKDRWLAAYDVAVLIRSVNDSAEKLRISRELTDILHNNVGDQEPVLEAYLLVALGQLGQPGGIDPILKRLDAPHARTRQGAISAVLAWPDRSQTRVALPSLSGRLTDEEESVGVAAAAALGEIATASDQAVIESLRQAMDQPGTGMQEVRWNAAVALAKLGNPQGSRFVARVLLDRDALSEQLGVNPTQPANPQQEQHRQDRIILTTLASAPSMADKEIWDKIAQLADMDPSRTIRNAAQQLQLAKEHPAE